jgi:hypothetical protein
VWRSLIYTLQRVGNGCVDTRPRCRRKFIESLAFESSQFRENVDGSLFQAVAGRAVFGFDTELRGQCDDACPHRGVFRNHTPLHWYSVIRATFVLLICLLLSGCDDVLATAKLDSVQDDRLVGTWVDADDPEDAGVIEKSGDSYTMRSDKPDAEKTRFTLARAGDVEFAQLEEKCSGHVFSYPGDTRTCFRIVRVEFAEDSFTFAEIDIEEFQDANDLHLKYKIASTFEKDGESTVCALIEASPPELLAFLAAYPEDGYKEGSRMRRR